MEQSEHELILKEVVKCVYESNWAIFEENQERHISAACFQIDSVKEIVIRMAKAFVSKVDAESIVGYSEEMDQAAIGIVTVVAYTLNKPLFTYVMSDDNTRSLYIGGRTCSVILAYVSSTQQIMDVLEIIERQGGGVKQVIALVMEKDIPREMFTGKHIQFESLLHLDEIIKGLETLDVPNKEELNSRINLLRR